MAVVDGPLAAAPAWTAPGAGAIVCFEGVVRPQEGGRAITGLEYERYEPMTTRSLSSLAVEIAARHGCLALEVEHSVGLVPAGATSFRLRVATTHRAAAFAAAAEYLERMKRETPLWKVARFEEPG